MDSKVSLAASEVGLGPRFGRVDINQNMVNEKQESKFVAVERGALSSLLAAYESLHGLAEVVECHCFDTEADLAEAGLDSQPVNCSDHRHDERAWASVQAALNVDPVQVCVELGLDEPGCVVVLDGDPEVTVSNSGFDGYQFFDADALVASVTEARQRAAGNRVADYECIEGCGPAVHLHGSKMGLEPCCGGHDDCGDKLGEEFARSLSEAFGPNWGERDVRRCLREAGIDPDSEYGSSVFVVAMVSSADAGAFEEEE